MSISKHTACWLVSAALLGGSVPAFAQQPQLDNLKTMEQFISLMDGYYGLIERIHDVASDPDKSAILQLQKIEDIYKKRGDRAQAIVVLRDAMDRAKSPTVRNAAAMMLADALNETGQGSDAVSVLQQALSANLK